MLDKLIDNNCLNKLEFLLVHYKKIGLSEDELVIVMLIIHNSNLNQNFLTPIELANYCNFSEKYIEEVISNLQKNNLLDIVKKNDKLSLDFSSIFAKIQNNLEQEYAFEKNEYVMRQFNSVLKEPLSKEDFQEIITITQNKLSDLQISIILSGISEKINVNNLKKIINNYIDKKPKEVTNFNWLIE